MNPVHGQRWYHNGYKMVVEIAEPQLVAGSPGYSVVVLQTGTVTYSRGQMMSYHEAVRELVRGNFIRRECWGERITVRLVDGVMFLYYSDGVRIEFEPEPDNPGWHDFGDENSLDWEVFQQT